MKKSIYLFLILLLIILSNASIPAVQDTSSVKTVVNGVLKRFTKELTFSEIENLTLDKILCLLTPKEKEIFSSGYLSFSIDQPAAVFVACYEYDPVPFWLSEHGFQLTEYTITSSKEHAYKVWRKDFSTGMIGLGVNSIAKSDYHYLVFIKPHTKKGVLISDLSPSGYEIEKAKIGTRIYLERPDEIETLSHELIDCHFIRTAHTNAKIGQLLQQLFVTPFPSSFDPDHIVLSWEDDPRTTQTISWRTDTTVTDGYVLYQCKKDYDSFFRREPLKVHVLTNRIETHNIVNDPVIHRHSVTLNGLASNEKYVYSVGDGGNNWSNVYEFNTAPDRIEPFSFMYLGDVQEGYERWKSLMKNALRQRPDIAFIMIAGDLVDQGINRREWDQFFENASDIFATTPLMPALGDNDSKGGKIPDLYLNLFSLPLNGPKELRQERAYSFTYSNAIFLSLDTNENLDPQVRWLDEQLTQSRATWKFSILHHPLYSSSPERNRPTIRAALVPVFDKHRVDMVFQGHDHAYLRTYPMRNNERMTSANEGTVYIVSTAGIKTRPCGSFDYVEHSINDKATFQIVDIQLNNDRLLYRCYDIDGKQLDEFEIKK